MDFNADRAPLSPEADASLPTPYRYIARQAILDRQGRVSAYELLHRQGPVTYFQGDGHLATQTVIDNTILFGLQNLTQALPAFVNCTSESLTGDLIAVLPPQNVVLEILEDVEPTPEVIQACRSLKTAGYRLALDDFTYRPELEPLIEMADFIKLDYLNTTSLERRRTLQHLGRFRGTLIAEKVEDLPDYDEARRDGCRLFQGYYFCKPISLRQRTIPANRQVHLRLLSLFQQQPLDLTAIGEILKLEPSVTYRLLRYVNSPLCGARQPVSSIATALLVLGDDMVRRIGTLALVSELNAGPSPEILRMALVRARFCELSSAFGSLDEKEQYLLGLFSLLPAMLQCPMEQVLSGLPLAPSTRDALLGASPLHRRSLDWLELHERGEFAKAEAFANLHGAQGGLLAENFTQATLWADKLLSA